MRGQPPHLLRVGASSCSHTQGVLRAQRIEEDLNGGTEEALGQARCRAHSAAERRGAGDFCVRCLPQSEAQGRPSQGKKGQAARQVRNAPAPLKHEPLQHCRRKLCVLRVGLALACARPALSTEHMELHAGVRSGCLGGAHGLAQRRGAALKAAREERSGSSRRSTEAGGA